MQKDSDIVAARFFGYGSLVNRATHDYPGAEPARLTGWRRVWVHTPMRPVAFLSVEPAAGVTIAGVVADVPGGDWAALDAREFAYARHPVVAVAGAGDVPAQVYAVPVGQPPSDRHPILLSYLDAVVQGFLREYGPAGAADFFATTAGWNAPVLDDRAAPRYPRAQTLSPADRAAVDTALAGLGVRLVRPA
ncbi:MAG: gamma-glutamylcyclotransferase family protein [Gemmobacter sp.]|nr:gamma-glutamylcyclotransferase family protein [Gemmobacter sp.]